MSTNTEEDRTVANSEEENDQSDYNAEEFAGEEYGARYVCMKREIPEAEVCTSKASSCTEVRTTTGNILERMVTDPVGRRPPCLGKWPAYPPKSEADLKDNVHQHKAAQQPTTLGQICSLRVTSDPHKFRQPAIVATLGPSCVDTDSIVEVLEAGANIMRISLAHIDQCSPAESFQNIYDASNEFRTIKDFDIPIAVMVELKGHEIRTGKVASSRKSQGPKDLRLRQGAIVKLTNIKLFENHCTEKMIYFNCEEPINFFEEGMIIYIGEDKIKLKVKGIESLTIVCQVEIGGFLYNNQKVFIPLLPRVASSVTDFDLECLELLINMEVDILVVPNARNEIVIKQVRNNLAALKEDNDIMILASISSYEGLENIDNIIQASDGIVIKKSELAFEVTAEKLFVAQKEIIGKCNRFGKPILCTGQLSFLKTMSASLERIEVSDIAGAIVDGADGIILIKETALYNEGVQAVTQLCRIIREAEAVTMQKPFHFDLVDEQVPSIEPSKAIALAAVQIANKIQAAAILVVTTSGRTAQMLSWFRPRRPVIAITRVGKTARQLTMFRSVIPLQFTAPVLPDWFHDVKARFDYGVSYGKEKKIISPGDLLVLVSGFRKKSGFTNCIRIVFSNLEKNSFIDNLSNYYLTSSA